MDKRILVVSSANLDFVQRMRRVPRAGETVTETDVGYSYVPGGKGANSAVTSAEDLLADGTLSTESGKSTLTMSRGIRLQAEKNWMLEIEGKSTGAFNAVFSTNTEISKGPYFWITETGDFCIVEKGGYTADDGTAAPSSGYTYYKVSDADFAANMPKNFKISEYHTYQMRCEEGVFSFWLDGGKIGDLAMTEYGTGRSSENKEFTGQGTYHLGSHSNFTSLKVTHMGNGNSSGSPIFGLDATVKELGIYPAHSYDNSCDTTCNNDLVYFTI